MRDLCSRIRPVGRRRLVCSAGTVTVTVIFPIRIRLVMGQRQVLFNRFEFHCITKYDTWSIVCRRKTVEVNIEADQPYDPKSQSIIDGAKERRGSEVEARPALRADGHLITALPAADIGQVAIAPERVLQARCRERLRRQIHGAVE